MERALPGETPKTSIGQHDVSSWHPLDAGTSLTDLYHINTRNLTRDALMRKAYQVHFSPRTVQLMLGGNKKYPNRARLPLPEPRDLSGFSLTAAMLSRHSGRDFAGKALSIEGLATLLFFSIGATVVQHDATYPLTRRPVPSSGGFNAINVYPVCTRVPGVPNGVYYYDPADHMLVALDERKDLEQKLRRSLYQVEFSQAAALLVVVGDLGRLRAKYGERAYRLLHLDAGHVGQNLCLVSAAMSMTCCPTAGYLEAEMEAIVDIDGDSEIVMYCFALAEGDPL